VYAENMPLQVLGVPLALPRCGIRARRNHAEMTFMNELWFAVVPPPSPTSLVMLLPKASTNLSGAEALLDLSGWLMKGLRQVGGTPKCDNAATRNSSFENAVFFARKLP